MQMFSHFQKSRAPSCVMVIWEDKCHDSKCSAFLFPSSHLLLLNVMSYGMEYHFGQMESPVLATWPVRSQFLVHPQHPYCQGTVRSRKVLGAVQALLSNNSNIGVLSLFWSQIQNISWYEPLWKIQTLPQPKPGLAHILWIPRTSVPLLSHSFLFFFCFCFLVLPFLSSSSHIFVLFSLLVLFSIKIIVIVWSVRLAFRSLPNSSIYNW